MKSEKSTSLGTQLSYTEGLQDLSTIVTTAGASTSSGSGPSTLTSPLSFLTLNELIAKAGELGDLKECDASTLKDLRVVLSECETKARNTLSNIVGGLRNVQEEMWRRYFRLTMGCIVRKTKRDHKTDKCYMVSRIEHRSWSKDKERPWIQGRLIRKDGKASQGKPYSLYDHWIFERAAI